MSLRRLHALSWGLRSEETFKSLQQQIQEPSRELPFISVDPALTTAVGFAVGEGLVVRGTGAKLGLTRLGRETADEILAAGTLVEEAERAEALKTIATEGAIRFLLKRSRRCEP